MGLGKDKTASRQAPGPLPAEGPLRQKSLGKILYRARKRVKLSRVTTKKCAKYYTKGNGEKCQKA